MEGHFFHRRRLYYARIVDTPINREPFKQRRAHDSRSDPAADQEARVALVEVQLQSLASMRRQFVLIGAPGERQRLRAPGEVADRTRAACRRAMHIHHRTAAQTRG